MPRFVDLPLDFACPHQHGCPYLDGLSTQWVWERYQETGGLESDYEHQLTQLQQELDEAHHEIDQLKSQLQQLEAQLRALHQRQFKGRRRPPPAPDPKDPASQPKRRGRATRPSALAARQT